MDILARDNGYGKILAKAPASLRPIFTRKGYGQEATVPGFFRGVDDMVFMAKYLFPKRGLEKHKAQIQEILAVAQKRTNHNVGKSWEKRYTIRQCVASDTERMKSFYQQIFQTYPFPIYDAEYLIDTMKHNIRYFCVLEGKRIIALASSEIDYDSLSVEMMAFATLPDLRGQGGCIPVAFTYGKGNETTWNVHRLYHCQDSFFRHEYKMCKNGLQSCRYTEE